MALDAQEMTDALDYQSELWEKLAEYLQGVWKGLTDAFVLYRLDNTFVRDVGLATFLPIYPGIANNVMPSLGKSAGRFRNDDLPEEEKVVMRNQMINTRITALLRNVGIDQVLGPDRPKNYRQGRPSISFNTVRLKLSHCHSRLGRFTFYFHTSRLAQGPPVLQSPRFDLREEG